MNQMELEINLEAESMSRSGAFADDKQRRLSYKKRESAMMPVRFTDSKQGT